MSHQGFGFCEFLSEEDAEYACRIMNGIKMFGKPIRVNKVCTCMSFSWTVISLLCNFMHTIRLRLIKDR